MRSHSAERGGGERHLSITGEDSYSWEKKESADGMQKKYSGVVKFGARGGDRAPEIVRLK